jgi:8-oxo-dGTP diphosphatase
MLNTKRNSGPAEADQALHVTVDVVVFTLLDGDLQVLLVHRSRPPQAGRWSLPGGPIGPDEALEDAALRILAQETGLADLYLEQLYTFGQPDRHPDRRVIAVAYLAIVPADQGATATAVRRDLEIALRSPTAPTPRTEPIPAGAPDAGRRQLDLGWWSVYDLPHLAFDHRHIIRYALTRLRYKLEYTAVGFELLPQEFTLTELQIAYEIVLGEGLDKRNFRRKILGAGIIEPSGGYRSGEGRPARLYRYRDDAVAEVKARRLFP